MANDYFIPVDRASTEIIILRSRFISTAAYTPTVDAAKAFIAEINQTYQDASHNVYAFAVGYGATVTHGMSDDGEPKGTAGKPTLAVVKGCGLGDVTVVTTRYFGGTKLGTGGLVKAYTESAQLVLAEIPRLEKIDKLEKMFSMPYNLYEQVKRFVDQHDGEILDQEFGVDVTLVISLPEGRWPSLADALIELSAGRIQLD
ncbi:MAG: YigZ family protein [Chloroflexota bacterium]